MMPHSPPGGKDKIMFRRGLFPGAAGDCFDETVPSGDEPALPGKATLISSTAFPEFTRDFYRNPLENGTPYKMLKMSALSGFRS